MKRTVLKRGTSVLKRRTPLRARRNKPEMRVGKVTGKIRLSGLKLEALRESAYYRAGGRCQWSGCGAILPLYGSVFNRAHLIHLVSRGAGGSDTIENTRIGCYFHHIECEHATGEKHWQ